MPFFCRSSHLVVTVDQFLSFVGPYLSQEAELHLPPFSGGDLQEVARAKKSTAGGLNGWAWTEVKALPLFLGLLGWLFCLTSSSLLVLGHRVCMMLTLL